MHRETGKDLYLVEVDGECREKCPRMTEMNYEMHKCESIASDEVIDVTSWPMLMLMASVAAPILTVTLSRFTS